MNELAALWPDPDRRDDALLRCLQDTYRAQPRRHLTAAEVKVVEALSHGLGRNGAAEVLGLGLETVKARIRDGKAALGCKDQAHLVAESLRRGLIR